MTLRARILTLFALLGVGPILALGFFNYVRSLDAVEALLEAETSAIAHRIVTEVRERHALRIGELLLVAENAETQALYRAWDDTADRSLEEARAAADAYLDDAWRLFQSSYRWIELRDTAGTVLHTLGRSAATAAGGGLPAGGVFQLRLPVHDIETGRVHGEVVAAVRSSAILPDELLARVFGRAGYTAVLDRGSDAVLHHPDRGFLNQAVKRLTGPEGWDMGPSGLAADSGTFRYRERDSARVASFLDLTAPPWTVVSSAAVDEFAPPFHRIRTANLLVMLLFAAVIGGAFFLVTRRVTASLEQLTAAADDVARGELSPRLPEAGSDEVGRLSRAFGLMVEEVRHMLRRVEETRDMALIGEFASQVAHEIRNPLTSIKLNLQGLGRDVEAGRIPEDSAPPVRISLREVDRLERSVERVLGLARTHPPVRSPRSVHQILDDAVEAVASQLEEQKVRVVRSYRAEEDRVLADPEDLEGVFVNLLLNAAEAMPTGGRVRVGTEKGHGAVRVFVSDDGPGIPPEIRGQIFRPFVTTKPESTGFGLALARRTVEAHDGRIDLARTPDDAAHEGGATFVVELPLSVEEKEVGHY